MGEIAPCHSATAYSVRDWRSYVTMSSSALCSQRASLIKPKLSSVRFVAVSFQLVFFLFCSESWFFYWCCSLLLTRSGLIFVKTLPWKCTAQPVWFCWLTDWLVYSDATNVHPHWLEIRIKHHSNTEILCTVLRLYLMIKLLLNFARCQFLT